MNLPPPDRGPHRGPLPFSLRLRLVFTEGAPSYDFARLMEGATEVKCSEFGDNIIAHM